MLWQLIKLLCLPLVYQSSVMEDVCENGISTEELDKIEVACQFHYHNLPDYCFVRTAVRAISDPSFFEQHVLHGGPDQPAASTTTRAVYTTHLQNLHTWGVVRSIGSLCIRTICRYFAVAKTENTSRSIFDGRNISLLCHPPPGMRLPDTVHISGFFGSFPGNVRMRSLDLRHYFHQIPLHDKIGDYFVVKVGGKQYAWKALPMGWSWSPSIAQALTIAIAIEAARNVRMGKTKLAPRIKLEDSSTVPGYFEIEAGTAKARVYITYDNVMFIGDEGLVDRWYSAFEHSCQARNVAIKEGSELQRSLKEMKNEAPCLITWEWSCRCRRPADAKCMLRENPEKNGPKRSSRWMSNGPIGPPLGPSG